MFLKSDTGSIPGGKHFSILYKVKKADAAKTPALKKFIRFITASV